MDKSSQVLENLTTPQPQLPIGYHYLSFDPLLVGKEIDLVSYLVCLTISERDSLVSIPNQPLVEKSVDLVPPPIAHSIPEEGGDDTAHVLLVSSDFHESKSDHSISFVQESPSPIPIQHGGNHTLTPTKYLCHLF